MTDITKKPVFIDLYRADKIKTETRISELESELMDLKKNLGPSSEIKHQARDWYNQHKDSTDFDVILGPEFGEDYYQDMIKAAIQSKGRLYFGGVASEGYDLPHEKLVSTIKSLDLKPSDIEIVDLGLNRWIEGTTFESDDEHTFPHHYSIDNLSKVGLKPSNVRDVNIFMILEGSYLYDSPNKEAMTKEFREEYVKDISPMVKIIGLCSQDQAKMTNNLLAYGTELQNKVPVVEFYEHSANPALVKLHGLNLFKDD